MNNQGELWPLQCLGLPRVCLVPACYCVELYCEQHRPSSLPPKSRQNIRKGPRSKYQAPPCVGISGDGTEARSSGAKSVRGARAPASCLPLAASAWPLGPACIERHAAGSVPGRMPNMTMLYVISVHDTALQR